MTPFNPETVQIQLVTDTQTAYDFLHWIQTVPDQLIGVDVETDGLDWFDGQLRLVQFGTMNEGWAVPFQQFRGLVREALDVLTARNKYMVGHNFHFDLHWLEQHTGWKPSSWSFMHDTMLLAGVINSSGTKKLKDLAEYYVHPVAKAGQNALKDAMKEHGWTWATVPIELPAYWVYGVLDTILTVNLFYVLFDKAQREGVLTAYDTERGCAPVLYSMERKGMLVDGEHCRAEMARIEEQNDAIEQAVLEYGIEQIGSSAQLALAFERAGVLLTEKTPGGAWAMNKDAFEIIVAQNGNHPLVQMIKDYRGGVKMSGSYYSNFLKFQASDGRVHPSFWQIQARTGRMSATDPAIQTLPRGDTPTAVPVRNSFIAPEGSLLVSTDFSNVEARIFAHFANETGMIQAIKDDMDLHSYTAKQIFNLDYFPDKHDPQRQIAKNCLFCTLFGGGAGKLAITGGVSFEEADRTLKGLHAAFPGIKQFQKAATGMAVDNLNNYGRAFVRGIDDRILAMVETDDRYYAFTNWLIQSTATIVLKKRMAVIDAMDLTQYCVAAIHDEIVAEVPEEHIDDYIHDIEEAMNDFESFAVPIACATGTPAQRLGDAK